MPCTLRIGLTGGIGSGKSTVAGLFQALRVPVIDADRVARELVEPGEPALAEVIAAFGPEVVQADGRLDRARLRTRVFADPQARARVEAILHPRIRARMAALAEGLSAPYCILCVPLLVEAGQLDLVDRVLVVDAPEAVQLERVCRRDGGTPALAQVILASQAPRAARLAAADDVIRNDGDLHALRREVTRLHEGYLRLAARGLRPAGG